MVKKRKRATKTTNVKQEVTRSAINKYLGRKLEEDSAIDPNEEISLRMWMEEEGYEMLDKDQINQTEIAKMFNLSGTRVSRLMKEMRKQKASQKINDYRRKLGNLPKYVLKKSNGENDMSEENEDESEEVLELTGEERDLIDLMQAMGVGEKVQHKVIIFYKKAPTAYAHHHGLYQLLVTCGIKPDWARHIVSNFLYSKGAPIGYNQGSQQYDGNLPMTSGAVNPYPNPYGNQPGRGNDGEEADFNKMFNKMMMGYFAKMMGGMLSGEEKRGPVPFVASEIVQKPIIGPDGKLMTDERGNILYETTRREKPLTPTTGIVQPSAGSKGDITMKDLIELVKYMQTTKTDSKNDTDIEKQLYNTLLNKLERVEGKLSDERMGQLYQEIQALRSRDPVKQYMEWKTTFDQFNTGDGSNIEIEKIKLDQQLKLKELEMKQGDSDKARELVEGLRQSFDTGIVNVAAPLVGAVAAGVEKKMSETPQAAAPATNTGGGGGVETPNFATMTDEELQHYLSAIDNAKVNAANLEHAIMSEVNKRHTNQETVRPTTTPPVPPAQPATYTQVEPAPEVAPEPTPVPVPELPPPVTQHVDPIPKDKDGLPEKAKRRFGVLTARGTDDGF